MSSAKSLSEDQIIQKMVLVNRSDHPVETRVFWNYNQVHKKFFLVHLFLYFKKFSLKKRKDMDFFGHSRIHFFEMLSFYWPSAVVSIFDLMYQMLIIFELNAEKTKRIFLICSTWIRKKELMVFKIGATSLGINEILKKMSCTSNKSIRDWFVDRSRIRKCTINSIPDNEYSSIILIDAFWISSMMNLL